MKSCAAPVSFAVGLMCVIAADAKGLSITTIKEEPYAMSAGSELEGYCVDLADRLSRKLGLQFRMHLVKDDRYGIMDASGNWNGMIGEVIRGEADLAVAPLTITATRENVVDMTTPFIQTGIGFILRKDSSTAESTFSLLLPFSTGMWVGIIIAFLLTGFCMFLVGRVSPTEWPEPETEGQSFTLLHSFWYISGALALQGVGPHPRGFSGRLISAIWWFFAVLLLICYCSNFNAVHSRTKHASVMSFEDLASQNVIDYGTVDGGSTKMFFKNSNNAVYRRMYEHMERKKSFVSSMEEGVQRARMESFAFIGEAVSLDLAVSRYCRLTRSQEVIAMRSYGIAAPLGSPLVKNLSIAVLQLSESGELTYLRDKWWASRCLLGGEGALQPAELQGPFLLLGLGLGLGLLLGLIELLSRARSRAKGSKRSCCSVLMSELNLRFGKGGGNVGQGGAERSKA
ncbi:probable glutamate receptor [Brachionichthys hirsutus]|uniref:probable glutamate receptor n=1 Tax=Brachionichthys hirsutus TaxID=412623 RepID=UPI003604C0F7